MITKQEILFLQESNAIEGVYDAESLQHAIFAWEYLKKQKELTIDVVLKTHKILMLHQGILPRERGYFRKCEVRVGNKTMLGWDAVPYAIDLWTKRIRDIEINKYCDSDLEIMSQNLHVQYENIHPFVDGNGRTGRMFMNWWRLSREMNILVIKESEKEEYYKWFRPY